MITDPNTTPGNTPLHPDDAAGMIPNLAVRRELDQWERQNILKAQKWAFSSRVMRNRDPLDEIYLRELHRKMFDQTWNWAGKYRVWDGINIGCPFAQIQERIGVLLGDAKYWIQHGSFPIDEIGVRFHHRLVWTIHAFPNGNGRHSRLLANIVVVKHGRPRFTWGRTNLGSEGPARAAYFKALHALDENDNNIQSLLEFARS